LRALRARLELSQDLFSRVVGCDLSMDAIENFKSNLKLNNLSRVFFTPAEEDITIVLEDTIKHMSSKAYPDFFDVVDIDPYGSAVPFLASAFKSVSNMGILAITCTDMRVTPFSSRFSPAQTFTSVFTCTEPSEVGCPALRKMASESLWGPSIG
jgi:tRNA (guanine26-N2/guanine27-N2)-dimethyltransferase